MSGLFGDDPITGTDEAPDRLGRQLYARHLSPLLERVAATSESSVLALIGPWGGGKSSVLEMTLRHLREQEKNWRIAEFNPWAYSDLDEMIVGFFEEILFALPEERRPKETRDTVAAWVRKLSWTGKAGGVVGIDLESTIDRLGNLIGGDTSPSARRRKVAEAIAAAEQKILMVLDDLDRLSPPELLMVFKLVRFVGRLPGVYYLLSYDESTLLDTLAHTELCGGSPARARDYLEKIVQVRLDLPPLREQQAAQMVWLGIRDLAESLAVETTSGDLDRFEQAYKLYLHERLRTPRAINRYLAQVDALYTFLGEEVDFFDFAILTFVRTFEPALYATLHRLRSELTVTAASSRSRDEHGWQLILTSAGIRAEHEEGILGTLALLFPVIGGGVTGREAAAIAGRKGVGHGDYFDRYFGFTVPEEEIGDAEVRETLGLLHSLDEDDPRLRKLVLRLLTDTERLVRKLVIRRSHEPREAEALLRLLARHFGDLTDLPVGDGPSHRQRVERLARGLVADVEDAAPMILADISDGLGGMLLATRLLVSSRDRQPDVVREQSGRIGKLVGTHVNVPFPDVPQDVKQLIVAWSLLDSPACREWLQKSVADGVWDPLDIAGWQIAMRPNGVSYLDKEVIDRLVGIDYLVETLGPRSDDTDLSPPFPDTPQGRRDAAALALRMLRDRAAKRVTQA